MHKSHVKYSRELILITCKSEIHFVSVHAKGIGMYYLAPHGLDIHFKQTFILTVFVVMLLHCNSSTCTCTCMYNLYMFK